MRRRAFVKASASAAAGLVFVKPGSVYGTPANDAVLISSPVYFHPEHFAAAVEARKHCYLEKPVASDVHGTKQVEKAARPAAGKLSLTVGLQSHYAPAYEEMVRRIHAGAIGP